MGGSDQWNLQVGELGANRTIITIDLPGFASNAHLEAPDTIRGFAKFVWDELDRKEIGEIDLLGHSMGGMIVQEMIALKPERVKSLVLYGTAATGNLPGRFETFETSKMRVQKDGVSATAKRISATWFLAYEKAAEYENCAAIAERSSLQAMLAGLDAMKIWSREENLAKISCQTLIIWGEEDRTYRWPQVEELWKSIPKVNLSVLPGCAHATHLEKPGLFNAILQDFLN